MRKTKENTIKYTLAIQKQTFERFRAGLPTLGVPTAPLLSAVEPGSTLVVGYTRDAVKTLECNGFRFGLSKAF